MSRKWKVRAVAAGAERDVATGVIQFRPSDLPDHDENETDEQINVKLLERFMILRGMTRDACAGRVRGLIISGPAGVGKTHEVEEELDKWDPEGLNHTKSSGYIKATGLYKLLYQNREKGQVTMFDDADSIWFDETSLQFLKIACDTVNRRVLTYGADYALISDTGERIPSQFEFHGTVIFITNLDFDAQIDRGTKLAPHMSAMVSRSHYIDLAMRTKRDYLIRIFQTVDNGLLAGKDLTKDEQNDVLDFIEDNQHQLRELSLRMALKLATIRKTDSAAGDWKKVALLTCCRNAS